MPFWYALTLLLTVVEGAIYWHTSGPLTYLDRCIVRFVDAGDCVYGHDPRADQQPNCIVGDVHAACRLEALPESMGSASPLARCRANDSFRVAHRGHSVTNVLAGTMRLQDQSNHKEDNPMSEIATTYAPLPADDLSRALAFAQLDSPTAQHIGLVGNTYTITVAGKDTNGRFCVIDMHVPPGGGPGRIVTTSKRPSSCLKARWK